jgi:hypothetical protein
MEQTQISTAAQAQGDGDPSPVTIWDLGYLTSTEADETPITAKRLLHLTPVRRPEFVPMTVAEQLGASLVAQTQTVLGEVLNAIQRKCLLDLMPAWNRLLKVNGIEPSPQIRTALRRDWFWNEAFDAIVMALCRCETEYASVRWHVADMVIRGEAAIAAHDAAKSLREYETDPACKETADMLREHLAAYKRFAEGL